MARPVRRVPLGRRGADLIRMVATALAVTGMVLVVAGLRTQPPPEPSGLAPIPTAAAAERAPAASPSVRPATLRRSIPVRLDIAAIGVHTALIQLGLDADGTVTVPPLTRGAPAGWYRYFPTPGEPGPAVILGHVDTARDGPAVFYRLGALRAGDDVSIRRADGVTVIFTVTAVAQYRKSAFPTEKVYGAVGYPALRLVTCGGSFDRRRHSYRGNVVAYARLTAVVSPADRRAVPPG